MILISNLFTVPYPDISNLANVPYSHWKILRCGVLAEYFLKSTHSLVGAETARYRRMIFLPLRNYEEGLYGYE